MLALGFCHPPVVVRGRATEVEMSYYTFFKGALFKPLIRVLVRPRVVGSERVPATGGALLAGNHISGWDTLVIPAMLPRTMTFPAKAELFVGRGPVSRVVAWFVRAVGILPMDRTGGRASASSMDVVLDALREGKVVGIFPEGTRSPDGRLYRGRTGVARLALATGVPVIPVGVQHTRPPSLHRAVVRFGEPLDFSAYAGAGNDRDVLRHVTDQVMAAIQELSGQRYVETYANGVKAALREGRTLDLVEVARPGLGRTAPPLPGRP
ncbi:1-acyl-sn-glycerol-3-phosphate acyltransferase [Friedmanniella antarctica]|uniref:1-acyl-sn-glycerol-3-phosphate acyltransferase n=2 Tax=Microlunatus antarcticus TaxID=53388 RepID=A0A7W5P890_9ACTN|nr:lysophospholipid acyltransferase family protein [Microlunatus antarcticus]MBB3328328.1 1-acyl-sn-glycerol-3-phosphate acyltransferase [Microlunatus antarcticus]